MCPTLIGLTHDLAALHLLVERVKSGQGQAALVSGEALIMLQRFDEASQALQDAKRGAQERQEPSLLWNIHCLAGHLEQFLKHEDVAQCEFSTAREIIGSLATSIDDEALRTHFLQATLKLLPKGKSLSPAC